MLFTSVQPDACLRVRMWAVADWQQIHRGQPLGALAGTALPGHAWGRTRGDSLSVQPVALAEEMRWATARDALGLAGLAVHTGSTKPCSNLSQTSLSFFSENQIPKVTSLP